MTTSQNLGSSSNNANNTFNGSNGTGSSFEKNVSQASSGAHEAIDKATSAARPTVDRIALSAHHAVDKLADVATHAAETLGIKGEQLKNAQQRIVEDCRSYVKEKPLTSLGIAVAAGYLLSRLLGSR